MDSFLFVILLIFMTTVFYFLFDLYWKYKGRVLTLRELFLQEKIAQVRKLEAENELLRLSMEMEWDQFLMTELRGDPGQSGSDMENECPTWKE